MHGKQHNIVIKGKVTGVKDTVLHLDYNTYQHVVLGKLFNHFLLHLLHLQKVDHNFRLCHSVCWTLGEMIHLRLLGEGLASSKCSVSTSSSLWHCSTRLRVARRWPSWEPLSKGGDVDSLRAWSSVCGVCIGTQPSRLTGWRQWLLAVFRGSRKVCGNGPSDSNPSGCLRLMPSFPRVVWSVGAWREGLNWGKWCFK